ncbi:MAG: VWA domain-containing protein [Terriglobales bacterium]
MSLYLAVLLFASLISAQNTASNSQLPTFRAQTELVTVPVVVTRGGKHVSGLIKDNFSISENGDPRPIASFEEIKVRTEPVKRVAAAPGVYTNELTEDAGPIGLNIILLDVLNTPALVQANARRNIVKFLSRSVQTNEPTMLVVLGRSGMKVVHSFTTDTSVLTSALKKVSSTNEGEHVGLADVQAEEELKGTNSISNPIDVSKEGLDLSSFMNVPKASLREAITAEEKDRARMTMELMANLARAVQGIPGRKTLLWATGDIPCTAAAGAINMMDMAQLCEQTWNALSASNIAIYPIDLGQTTNPVYSSPQYRSSTTPRYTVLQNLFVQSFAAYTGGTVCTFRSDLDTCFRRAIEDSEQYYLLSYYADKAKKPGWRKIKVKVNAEGVQVRARSGYYTLGKTVDEEARQKLDVAWASLSPIDYTGIPIAVEWRRKLFKDGKLHQEFNIAIDPKALTIDTDEQNHMKLDVAAVAHDKKDAIAGDVNQTVEAHLEPASVQKMMQGGFRYTNVIDLPPGVYSVKFIVRDDLSARMGTVTVPLTVEAPPGH